MSVKLTTEEFTERSNKIHEYKYDYSLVEYLGSKLKVEIICSEHGIFEQSAEKHFRGQGCPKCVNKNITTEEFIKKVRNIHTNKYDYSLVQYNNSLKAVKIICPEHGEFKQTPKNHLKYGCIKCGIKLNANKSRLTLKEFISDSKLVHGDKYDYSKVNYDNCMKKVSIICSNHGDFKQTPNAHKRGDGCPKCKFSNGEKMIYKILKENMVKLEGEKKFNDCKYILHLKFDFYLPKQNVCIEYHGNQHFESVEYFGGIEKLKETQKRDKIKEKYCKENNIGLIILWKIDKEIYFVDLYNNSPEIVLNLLNFKQLESQEFYKYRTLRDK